MKISFYLKCSLQISSLWIIELKIFVINEVIYSNEASFLTVAFKILYIEKYSYTFKIDS